MDSMVCKSAMASAQLSGRVLRVPDLTAKRADYLHVANCQVLVPDSTRSGRHQQVHSFASQAATAPLGSHTNTTGYAMLSGRLAHLYRTTALT